MGRIAEENGSPPCYESDIKFLSELYRTELFVRVVFEPSRLRSKNKVRHEGSQNKEVQEIILSRKLKT
jgi:hypothetical protein